MSRRKSRATTRHRAVAHISSDIGPLRWRRLTGNELALAGGTGASHAGSSSMPPRGCLPPNPGECMDIPVSVPTPSQNDVRPIGLWSYIHTTTIPIASRCLVADTRNGAHRQPLCRKRSSCATDPSRQERWTSHVCRMTGACRDWPSTRQRSASRSRRAVLADLAKPPALERTRLSP